MAKSWAIRCLFWGVLVSCGNDMHYTRRQFYQLGRAHDPNFSVVVDEEMRDWARCFDYGQGCVETFTAIYQGVSFVCVQYERAEQAQYSARALNAYLVKNWLLDQVRGEPTLEQFVIKAWGATRMEKK